MQAASILALLLNFHTNSSMGHSHSNSVLLSPGEKGELVWKFSNKAKIEAACNVPGHYEVGMIAKISEI